MAGHRLGGLIDGLVGGLIDEVHDRRNDRREDAGGRPSHIHRVVLTGFMGAGKTTVGKLLGTLLGWQFVDADVSIEAATGTTVAQLFQERGEPWFRQLEHETIRRLLESESLVLALGGGAIEDERTRALLLDTHGTQLIHLEASLPTVLQRCQGTEGLRPVLQDKANLERRYLSRLPLYRQAHLTLVVDAMHPDAAAQAILEHLGHAPKAESKTGHWT
jgi:shikimate kinase